ncbi:MAG: hypothetical protein HQ504_04295 [Rhodospirillaceae bacterium]|nr:hypothetical protein [Rhodospirillaceae bacterium]
MSDTEYPKDENLRLVLSTDQEEWLSQHIKVSKRYAWIMTFLLAISIAWLTAEFAGAFSRYDVPDCFTLSVDSPDYQVLLDEFVAEGLMPCAPEDSEDKGINWPEVRNAAKASALILLLISSLTLLRNLFLLNQYKGYLKDHQAFLVKYNRLQPKR